jgi:hypothetical protein
MSVRMLKTVSEGVGARRAITPSETVPTTFHFEVPMVPDPEVSDKAVSSPLKNSSSQISLFFDIFRA